MDEPGKDVPNLLGENTPDSKVPSRNLRTDHTESKKDKKNKFNWTALIQAITSIALVIFTYLLTQYASEQAKATKEAVKLSEIAVGISKETMNSGNDSFKKTLDEMKAQSKAMRDSADATKEAVQLAAHDISIAEESIRAEEERNRLDQRAWLEIKDVKFENKLEAGKINRLSLDIVNVGKTPAQQMNFRFTSFVSINGKNGPTNSMPSNHENISLGPGRTMHEYGFNVPKVLNKTDIDYLESGKMKLTISLKITYRDIFKDSLVHITEYCGYYDPKTDGQEFLACPSGNYLN